METNLSINSKKISGYSVTEKIHQDKPHLVVPVVMVVEGVLNGSHGPLLHLASEFGKYPDSWNGIPVVINHPEIDGNFVSANNPDLVDNAVVGRVYNSQLETNRLTAEVWLDTEKLGKVSNDTLVAVNKKKPIEVSVGVFTDDEEAEGDYEGIQYNAIARNHRPDHLALLPEAIGACSLEDGCGIRANQKKGGTNVEVTVDSAIQTLKENGMKVYEIVDNSEKGMVEKTDRLRDLVRSLNVYNDNGPSEWNYLIEVYDSYLVFEKEVSGVVKYFKQNYTFNAGTDAAELLGDAVEVKKKVEFELVTNKRVRTNFGKEKNEMCTPCIEKKVNALIANKATGFEESDREMLQGLTEKQLDNLVPKTIEVNAQMSAEDQAALDFGKKEMATRRAGYISTIQSNTSKDLWPDATLNAMSDEILEKMSKSFTAEEEVDYSLNGNQRQLNNNKGAGSVDPLLPAGVVIKG